MVATPLGVPGRRRGPGDRGDNLLRGDFVRRPPGSTVAELGSSSPPPWGSQSSVVASGVELDRAALARVGLLLWLGTAWLIGTRGWFVSPLFPTLALPGPRPRRVQRLVAERARADHSTRQLRTAREMVLHALTSLTETRDFETGAHLVRTSRYTRCCAKRCVPSEVPDFFTPETIDLIARLAPIHDIGKVGVADRTLRKPGPLSDDERDEMKRHPIYGRDVIVRTEERVGVRDDFLLTLAKQIVYSHHERWDGGVPGGLRGRRSPSPGEWSRSWTATMPSPARACTSAFRTRRSFRRSSPSEEPTSIPRCRHVGPHPGGVAPDRRRVRRRARRGPPVRGGPPPRARVTRRAGMLPTSPAQPHRCFRTGASAPRRGVSALLQ